MLVKKYGESDGRGTRAYNGLMTRLITGITAPRNQRPGFPPRLQMDLDHFVCACVVVRQMCELYDKCTIGGPRPGKSQISRDQFLETVILLP